MINLKLCSGIFCGSLLLVGYCCVLRYWDNRTSLQVTGNTSQKPSQQELGNNTTTISDEEYKIYTFLCQAETSTTTKIFISDKTIVGIVNPYSSFEEVYQAVEWFTKTRLPKDLTADYSHKNLQISEVLDKFTLRNEYKVADKNDFTTERYGVIFNFSRVGFNQKQDTALVYYNYYGGPKTAGGIYIILSKVNGTWKEVAKYTPWIS